ncbi:MAG: hypothetical protein VKO65_09985 [Cyanobacteriota bacterium]|nr:hypothetical protein [Cyanobacteriota bacterium]
MPHRTAAGRSAVPTGGHGCLTSLPPPAGECGPSAWLRAAGLSLLAFAAAWLLGAGAVQAAEVLQVRGPALLQIGDGNRSVPVELACIRPVAGQEAEAVAWLRRQLPRHTRVQLRPVGAHDGRLLAQVRRLDSADDLGGAMIAASLASAAPDCP